MFRVELENAYDVLWGEINPELSIVEFNAPQKEGDPVLACAYRTIWRPIVAWGI